MTSHSLNLANDVVNLTRQKKELDSKIQDAREEVEQHIREIALAAGMTEMDPKTLKIGLGMPVVGFYWPNP